LEYGDNSKLVITPILNLRHISGTSISELPEKLTLSPLQGSPLEVEKNIILQGVGARRATFAQAAEHVPNAELQARIAGAAAAAATTVPKVAPAAP